MLGINLVKSSIILGRPLTPITPRKCLRQPNRQIRATGSGDGNDDNLDELFRRELARRSISSVDDIPDKPSSSSSVQFQRRTTPPPSFAGGMEDDVPPQLQKSRELNSEGLEGLPGRAWALIQLGGGFFLAFGPFFIGVVLAFVAIYSVFGESFLHSGTLPSSPPTYIDPLDLLNEPTVDPMIPM